MSGQIKLRTPGKRVFEHTKPHLTLVQPAEQQKPASRLEFYFRIERDEAEMCSCESSRHAGCSLRSWAGLSLRRVRSLGEQSLTSISSEVGAMFLNMINGLDFLLFEGSKE